MVNLIKKNLGKLSDKQILPQILPIHFSINNR